MYIVFVIVYFHLSICYFHIVGCFQVRAVARPIIGWGGGGGTVREHEYMNTHPLRKLSRLATACFQ